MILSPMGYVVATVFVLYKERSLTQTAANQPSQALQTLDPTEVFATPEVYAVTNMTFSARKTPSISPKFNLPRVGSTSHIQSMTSPTSIIKLPQFSYPPTSQENEPETYLPKMTLNCSPNRNARAPVIWVCEYILVQHLWQLRHKPQHNPLEFAISTTR